MVTRGGLRGHNRVHPCLTACVGVAKETPEDDVMTTSKQPLKPEDFPVNAEGEKIKKQDGTPIANTDDPAVAADVAERLNDDEDRREEDKWSA
jgi:hypothetical protein